MGVKGLTRFIDSNPGLLKDYQLRDSRVIFDGNNLYHFLYHTYNIRQQFNGDYVNYAKKIKQVFHNLKKCNIQPCVIFDGGYNSDDRKHQTVLERARDRVKWSGKTSLRGSKNLLPVLAYETFRNILDNLDVEHATCDYEADEHIAILANKWNCPVISNDSDFYVYNIKAGFFPMDYVDFRIKHRKFKDRETGKNRKQLYILVQKYHHDHYTEVFGKFNPDFIPIIATVLGNDYVDSRVFSTFTARFKGSNKHKISKQYAKTVALMHWLKKFSSVDEAVQNILEHFVEERKPFILTTLQRSIISYTSINTAQTFLTEYFEGSLDVTTLQRNDFFGELLPSWMLDALLRAEIPPFVQNAVVLRRVILQCQVEEFRKPSSHEISKHIRRVIYGILFSSHNIEDAVDIKANRDTHIEEYDRKSSAVGKTFTSPITELNQFGSVIGIRSLPVTGVERRRDLLLHVLSVSKGFIVKFDSSMQLLMAITVYWARSAHIPKYHLAAYLLNVLILRIARYCKEKDKELEESLEKEKEFEDAMLEMKPISQKKKLSTGQLPVDDIQDEDVLAMKSVSLEDKQTFLDTTDFNTVFQSVQSSLDAIQRNVNRDIVNLPQVMWKYEWPPRLSHCYSQLQSCLLYCLTLNQLLLCPFENLVIPESYDGSTIFMLSKAMQTKQNMMLFAAKVLGGELKLLQLYQKLVETVCAEVGEDNFVQTYTMKRRRRKAERDTLANSNSVVEKDVVSSANLDTESSDDEDDVKRFAVDCEVVNRFSFL